MPTFYRTVLLLGLVSSTACSVSQDQEVAIGKQNAEEINAKLPLIREAAVVDYVQQLGMSMAQKTSRPDLDWRFFVVDSKEVNAFALPGGFIYVNRGLIDRAERLDELAGTIGHEIGHVVRRHSVQQMEKGTEANLAIGLTCTLTRLCDSRGAADVSRRVLRLASTGGGPHPSDRARDRGPRRILPARAQGG